LNAATKLRISESEAWREWVKKIELFIERKLKREIQTYAYIVGIINEKKIMSSMCVSVYVAKAQRSTYINQFRYNCSYILYVFILLENVSRRLYYNNNHNNNNSSNNAKHKSRNTV
jgi:hypothetical protein